MSWYITIETTSGNHELSFDKKEEAEAALAEAQQHMGLFSKDPVVIAGQLVVRANEITSAKVYESSLFV
jgi:hypothetical protein